MSSVTVSIVNFNHLRFLPSCLQALAAQAVPPERIVITDNASTDGSREWLLENASTCELLLNKRNEGYAAGHNRAFRDAATTYVMALNCDVTLDPGYFSAMLEVMSARPEAGSACGRISLGRHGGVNRIDSTGLFPDRFRRFRDRDHGMPDTGQRQEIEFVFGVSGSSALYRRAMLDDVAQAGMYFDEAFFAYCEDADLAWRAQKAGWKAVYVPGATGVHSHEENTRARSASRGADAEFRQMLLIRNRHLCFLKNDSPAELARDVPWVVGYDAALMAYLSIRKPRLGLRWPIEVVRGAKRIRRSTSTVRINLREWFA
jgi:GT2 family glycosyltransferase